MLTSGHGNRRKIAAKKSTFILFRMVASFSIPKGRLHSVLFCSDESRNLAHHVCMGDFDALRVRLEELC